jgi:hypothetical protein
MKAVNHFDAVTFLRQTSSPVRIRVRRYARHDLRYPADLLPPMHGSSEDEDRDSSHSGGGGDVGPKRHRRVSVRHVPLLIFFKVITGSLLYCGVAKYSSYKSTEFNLFSLVLFIC